MKKTIIILAIIVLGIAAFLIVRNRNPAPIIPQNATFDPRNSSFTIDNAPVNLKDGFYEAELASIPGAKITTRYFGNELKTDLNGDGREDVVFLVTQDGGGSGIFYYVVAVLNLPSGPVGSDGYLLGDRIAPQTTEVSQNPRHKNVIVVNYADRAPGEPMAAKPSVGKSVYLKLNPETMQWGIVQPDFEGESSSGVSGTVLLGPTCPVMKNPPDPQCADKPFKTSLAITTADQNSVIKTISSGEDGKFRAELAPGNYAIRSAAAANILPYCRSELFKVEINKITEVIVYCDSGIR